MTNPDPEKIDLFKANKGDYVAKKKPQLLNIETDTYMVISGKGAPGEEEFSARINAIYGMAFTVKMTRKFEGLGDYTICKLECQRFDSDGKMDFASIPKDQWEWKLLIRTPKTVTKKDLQKASAALTSKGKGLHTDQIALEKIKDGTCVQMLHLGPYEQIGETVTIMNTFMSEQGYKAKGPFREIYLSDPRRVDPEKLKTILRIPVKK